MKLSPTSSASAALILQLFLLIVLGVTTKAQDLTALPACSITCFSSALGDSGCDVTDTKCQCTSGRAVIEEDLEACLPGACSQEDIDKVFPVVRGICAQQGVTLTSTPHITATGTKTGSGGGGVTITGHHTLTGTAARGQATAVGANVVGAVAGVVGVGMGVVLGL